MIRCEASARRRGERAGRRRRTAGSREGQAARNPQLHRSPVIEFDRAELIADTNGGGEEWQLAEHRVARFQRFLREPPLPFTVLQGLRHMVECARKLAQFIFAVARACAGAQITAGQPRTRADECPDGVQHQESAPQPAERKRHRHSGPEPGQIAGQRTVGCRKQDGLRDAQDARRSVLDQSAVHACKGRDGATVSRPGSLDQAIRLEKSAPYQRRVRVRLTHSVIRGGKRARMIPLPSISVQVAAWGTCFAMGDPGRPTG